MHLRLLVLAFCTIWALPVTANAASADACKNILEQFKSAADRANRDISSAIDNLQNSASQVADDKKRVALIAQSCAASAEAAGVFKSYRIVVAECMADGERGRSDFLDTIDRSISRVRVSLDKACR
jgi:hypothetical protein